MINLTDNFIIEVENEKCEEGILALSKGEVNSLTLINNKTQLKEKFLGTLDSEDSIVGFESDMNTFIEKYGWKFNITKVSEDEYNERIRNFRGKCEPEKRASYTDVEQIS